MPSKQLSQIFQELPFEKKLLGIGSLLMIVSVFLPWYQDLDSFKTGDMFLGITGPLYIAGVSLLVMSVMNVALLFFEKTGRKLPYVNIKPSNFYFVSGIFAFFMLLLVNSVYFHPKFGINITLKQSQFGMFFAFIAASFITIGGYLAGRDKATLLREFQEEMEEDEFIHLPKQEKSTANLRNSEPAQSPEEVQQQVQQQTGFAEQSAQQQQQEQQSKPQPYRMDL
ncbi:MAG: hypothetical protein R3B71_00085 [Candidatus Gracilibacteria bacterium]|nr:hypothetical protein [Candidatus Peregrinibacteria bacterium]